MAYIVTLRGVRPKIGKNCFLAETAVIIGDVEIGDNCSIWYGAVLRGDVGRITLGNGVNIQDGAVVHSTAGVSVVVIGDGVSVGHNAIVHGAHVEPGALVGMGSTVLDNARVGAGALVAANALVLGNTQIPPMTLWAGVPAKQMRVLTPEQSVQMAQSNGQHYQEYAHLFATETSVEELPRT